MTTSICELTRMRRPLLPSSEGEEWRSPYHEKDAHHRTAQCDSGILRWIDKDIERKEDYQTDKSFQPRDEVIAVCFDKREKRHMNDK